MSDRSPHRLLRRLIPAYVLHFATAFMVFGLGVGWLTGGLTGRGFSLEGAAAVLAIALVAAYFFVCNRFPRDTLWRHVFGAGKPYKASSGAPETRAY